MIDSHDSSNYEVQPDKVISGATTGDTIATSDGSLAVVDWGLIDYQEAFRRQLDLVGLVQQELARETLIFCSHPPVVTLGRGTKPGDLDGWTGEIVEVNRGGRATYHGPSQIVVYPIIDLNHRSRDLHRYLRALEQAVVLTLAEHGVSAVGRSLQTNESEIESEATGVWVGSRKIASIGIGVRKWVTFHGLALNIDHDADAFRGLKPCGFNPEIMTSLQEILGSSTPSRDLLQQSLRQNLSHLLTAL